MDSQFVECTTIYRQQGRYREGTLRKYHRIYNLFVNHHKHNNNNNYTDIANV